MKNNAILALALAAIVGLSACVDKNYDLSDVDTDEITVGDNVVAPLGSGVIEASKLLDKDNVKEIKTEENGNYVIVYEDELNVSMPTTQDMKLEDVEVKVKPVTIPDEVPSSVALPLSQSFALEETEALLEFELPKEITRLDYVEFEESDRKSVFYLHVVANDFSLTQGEATLHLTVTFPERFEIEPLPYSYKSEANKNIYRCELPLDALEGGLELPIKVKKATGGMIAIASTIEAEAGTIMDKGAAPSLRLNGRFTALDYTVVYGTFNIKYNVAPSTLDMSDFSNIFEGDDNYLSFTDPHIKLNTVSNVGIPLEGVLSVTTVNSSKIAKDTHIPGINILPSPKPGEIKENYLWIGGTDTYIQPGYTLIENNDLRELIAISPDRTLFDMNIGIAPTAKPQFFVKGASASVKYEVEIPFAVTKDFRSRVTEMIDDAFDADFVDYVFKDGTATIFGEVKNTVPLDILMNLIIVDANGSPVGINLEPKQVAGSADGQPVSSEVSYTIEEKDMPKMASAKDIKMLLTITSSEKLAGINLKEGQKLELNLKLTKTGGITINSDNDNN